MRNCDLCVRPPLVVSNFIGYLLPHQLVSTCLFTLSREVPFRKNAIPSFSVISPSPSVSTALKRRRETSTDSKSMVERLSENGPFHKWRPTWIFNPTHDCTLFASVYTQMDRSEMVDTGQAYRSSRNCSRTHCNCRSTAIDRSLMRWFYKWWSIQIVPHAMSNMFFVEALTIGGNNITGVGAPGQQPWSVGAISEKRRVTRRKRILENMLIQKDTSMR